MLSIEVEYQYFLGLDSFPRAQFSVLKFCIFLFTFLLLLLLSEFDYEAMDFSSTDEEETGL